MALNQQGKKLQRSFIILIHKYSNNYILSNWELNQLYRKLHKIGPLHVWKNRDLTTHMLFSKHLGFSQASQRLLKDQLCTLHCKNNYFRPRHSRHLHSIFSRSIPYLSLYFKNEQMYKNAESSNEQEDRNTQSTNEQIDKNAESDNEPLDKKADENPESLNERTDKTAKSETNQADRSETIGLWAATYKEARKVDEREKPKRDSGPSPGTTFAEIVNSFPSGIQMAFVYGSGAIQHYNSRPTTENVLDLMLVVDNPRKWHQKNMKLHPKHYNRIFGILGPTIIAKFQNHRYGAGVYFNALVPMCGRMVKYGVVSTNRAIADLWAWESLYVAGRLQKPVYFIVLPTDQEVIDALRVNLRSATMAAFLLLPDEFTEEELYMTIASLSYSNIKHTKIYDLVQPNLGMFRRMYSNLLLDDEHVTWWPDEGILEQALSFHSRHHYLKQLPRGVLLDLLKGRYKVGRYPDLEEIIRNHAFESDCDKHVARSIRNIVRKSSVSQSFKNLMTFRISLSSMKFALSNLAWAIMMNELPSHRPKTWIEKDRQPEKPKNTEKPEKPEKPKKPEQLENRRKTDD